MPLSWTQPIPNLHLKEQLPVSPVSPIELVERVENVDPEPIQSVELIEKQQKKERKKKSEEVCKLEMVKKELKQFQKNA